MFTFVVTFPSILFSSFYVMSPYLPQAHIYSAQIYHGAQETLLLSPNSSLNLTPRKGSNVRHFFLTYLSPVISNQKKCSSYIPLCCRDHNSGTFYILEASELLYISLVEFCFLYLTVELTYCEEFSGHFVDTNNWILTKPSTSLSLISINYNFVVFFWVIRINSKTGRGWMAIEECVSLKRY